MAPRQDLERNLQSVRQALADRMIYSDRVCFAAATTLAADTGLHPCTVRRALTRLQASGVIERVHDFTVKGKKVRSCAWRFCVGVLRKPKCVTTETSFPKNTKTFNTFSVGAGPRRRNYGRKQRWRQTMGEVVPIGGSVEPSASVGQALFAAIVDELAATGVTVPRRLIATATKQGREALDDGVAPDVVLAGCLAALRSGKPQYTAHLIGDLAFAKAGQYLTPADYRKKLSETNLESNPALLRITATLDQIAADKQARKARNDDER